MTPEERWTGPTPRELLEMSLHVERGPMVIDDLRGLPDSPLVVAEGSAVPAHALSTRIADRSRAVWLIPTPDFQRALLAERGTAAGPTSLYLLLRETIALEAREHDAPVLCECGDRGCEGGVLLPVGDLSSTAVLAPSHHEPRPMPR